MTPRCGELLCTGMEALEPKTADVSLMRDAEGALA